MNFEEFLASKLRCKWVREQGIGLYVRKSIREGVDIDLANMSADEMGQGSLTRFLDKYEPFHVFYVENIHNPRLPAYLQKRGYASLTSRYGAVNMVSKNYGGPETKD